MKKHLKTVISHPLISGSAIIFTGTMVANVFHFLFNLFMGRNLSIADYGTLASINSLISLPVLAAGALTPIFVSFAAPYFAEGNTTMAHSLFLKLNKSIYLISIILFLIYLLFSPSIAQFFKINNMLIIWIGGGLIFLSLVNIVTTAFLQARLAFKFLAIMSLLSALTKFSSGALLVLSGYAINGAILGLLISFLIAYAITFIPLRDILTRRKTVASHIDTKSLLSYGLPSAIAIFSVTSFISTDLFLVKHFFSPHEAGIYAGIVLIGKVIFFFSAPIGMVMFPLVIQRLAKNENYHSIFLLSLLLVFLASTAITAFYFLFPTFTILFFIKRTEYLAGSSLLTPYAIFITLYSLLSVFVNFYISLKKTWIWRILLIGAALQGILIWLYHNSFLQIIYLSSSIVGLLLLYLLLYYLRLYGQRHKE